MPMYEYRCLECGQAYEQLRRMAQADVDLECPACGSRRVELKLSAFATSGGTGAAGQSAATSCGSRGRFS